LFWYHYIEPVRTEPAGWVWSGADKRLRQIGGHRLNEKRMAVILSCPSEQEESVRKALEPTCQAEDNRLKYEISKLIIQRVENFVLSPKHYNSWSANKKKRILEEFERIMTNPDAIQDHEDLLLF
jgi:hypothetical protein